jgi:RNA polymerase sigma-70 factor, ECF subfamily
LRIASNVIADRAKRQAKDGVRVDEPSLELAARSNSRQTQQTELEESERRAWVIRQVDELPDDQRRVVRLRFAEEKSISEIAAELGRSEGAVKQLQFRAFQTLRKELLSNE